jgi:hypothetical protein
MPTTVENFENSFGNRLFRRPNGTVHEDSDDDSAIHEKSPLRPTGTFERIKIEFRSGEVPVPDQKSTNGVASRGGYHVPYASRADRRSLMLIWVTIFSLVLMVGFIKFGPGSKYSLRRALNQMPTQPDATADGVVKTQSPAMKMKDVQNAQDQQSDNEETSEGDNQELQVSTKDQQSSMDEKFAQMRALKQQKPVKQPDEKGLSLPGDSPSWREPAKFGAAGLPSRIYDNMGYPEAAVSAKQDSASGK